MFIAGIASIPSQNAHAEIYVNSEGSQVRIGSGGIQVNTEGSDVNVGVPNYQPAQPTSVNCNIPLGTYRYLYSDGYQTFYYKDNYTIRTSSDGGNLLENGNFSYDVNGMNYTRSGNIFSFSNSAGTYTSVNGAPITFNGTGNLAQVIAMLPAGTVHNAEEGSYAKQSNGSVIFTPRRQLSDLVINEHNCGASVTKLDYDYDTVVQELGAQKVGDNLVINLDNDILFDFDSAQITPKAAERLKQLAYLIQQDRQGLVVVRGHADAKGSDEYNLKLSQQRAEAVAQWLTSLTGLDYTSFVAQGMGEAYPIAQNVNYDGTDNPVGRAQNRRVEVLIQTVQGAAVPEPQSIIVQQPSTPTSVIVNNGGVSVNAGGNINGGVSLVPGNLKYASAVVVSNPVILSGADTYKISGGMAVNSPLIIKDSASVKVAGKTYINSSTTLSDSAAMKIAGDLIVAAPLVMSGNSSIKASGSVTVVGNGRITKSGNAQIKSAY